MNKAYWVIDITVVDPESGGDVGLSVYKHQNGGMFAIDSSYVEQVMVDDEPIQDPLSSDDKVMLFDD